MFFNTLILDISGKQIKMKAFFFLLVVRRLGQHFLPARFLLLGSASLFPAAVHSLCLSSLGQLSSQCVFPWSTLQGCSSSESGSLFPAAYYGLLTQDCFPGSSRTFPLTFAPQTTCFPSGLLPRTLSISPFSLCL